LSAEEELPLRLRGVSPVAFRLEQLLAAVGVDDEEVAAVFGDLHVVDDERNAELVLDAADALVRVLRVAQKARSRATSASRLLS
jgi:hypothetical protein